jgi:hypothetical protein
LAGLSVHHGSFSPFLSGGMVVDPAAPLNNLSYKPTPAPDLGAYT